MKNNINELIAMRKSIRSYKFKEIEENVLTEILSILENENKAPFNSEVKFELVASDKMNGKIGTYGFISNAVYFIVCLFNPTNSKFVDIGYQFEKIILKMTDLNLGTCWIGGTFNREKINIPNNLYNIAVISPLGYPKDTLSFKDKIVRSFANANNRKSLVEIIINYDQVNQYPELSNVLENIRLAPSASNKQPWRLFINDSNQKLQIDFYLERTKGYSKLVKDVDLQLIDIGIAMYHLEATFNEMNKVGNWIIDYPKPVQPFEYVCSFQLEK